MAELPLNVGVIGCGVISEIYLQNCATVFPQLRLCAVADLDPEAANRRGSAFGLPALSPAALLARDDIDIVLNLTVPAAHVAVGLAAIAAGKHVYSEKPLGVSVVEAKTLIEAADRAGLRVGCAPDTFLGGSHQTSRKLVDDGAIGRVVAGSATLMLSGHEVWHPNPDFYYSDPGGGPAMDMGPYYLTALVNLLGAIARVTAFASRSGATRTIAKGPRAGQKVPVEVYTHIAGALEFASGAIVQIATSFDVKGHGHSHLEIYGTDGSMLVPDPNRFDGEVLRLDGSDWTPIPNSFGSADGNYRGFGLADMADAIVTGRPNRASGALALHVLEAIEGLTRSAATGRAVQMETHCDRPTALTPDEFG